MNKKFRFISAAATALLAVAPVATSAIAPVATTFAADTGTDGAGAGAGEQTPATAVSVSVVNNPYTVIGSTKGADGNPTGGTAVDSFLTSSSVGLIASYGTPAVGSVTLHDDTANTDVKAGDKFVGGHTYTQTINYSLSGLKAGQPYKVNDDKDADAKTATSGSVIDGLTITRTIYATDPSVSTQPYFTTEAKDANSKGTQVGDGALITPADGDTGYVKGAAGYTVPAKNSSDDSAFKSLTDLASALLTDAQVHAVKPTGTIITTTPAQIASQLSEQGVSVDAKGNVVSSGFIVTLTAQNTASGKTVSVKVPYAPVTATADTTGYPTITSNTGAAGASQESKGADQKADPTYIVPVKLGATDFDPIKTVGATAKTGDGNAAVTVSVVSNPVNVAVPGKYTVVLAATDWTTGKTTQLSYTVQVGDATGTFAQVQYVPGYSVVEWKVLGNTVSLAGAKASDGTTVETFDTTTIGGVSYTRVGSKDANTWIQTQYLDGSWKAAQPKPAQPTTPAAAETKVSGVATVTYKGAGKVRLVNANGKYVSQYVSKGSRWKVFAKKTINGNVYYRIGSQSQWVPAKYVSVK